MIEQIYLTYKTLAGATTLSQSGPESNGNEGVLHIFQSSSLVSYLLN